jgi:AraC family transcriptional regulator, transcriptional activator of pobA
MRITQLRPLLIQELNLRLPGLNVQRLTVNRHFPDKEWLAQHEHQHSQCLVYLTGGGILTVKNSRHRVQSGTLAFIPKSKRHAFERIGGSRRPLCLVVDFDFTKSQKYREVIIQLPFSDLTQIRHCLAELSSLQTTPKSVLAVKTSAIVLTLLDILLRGACVIPEKSRPLKSPVVRKLERVLSDTETAALPLNLIASKVGYQIDYLSRSLKQTEGVTLGQFRSQRQLRQAEKLLTNPISIREVSEKVGFSDQNYFARWFRQQTGVSPRTWRLKNM